MSIKLMLKFSFMCIGLALMLIGLLAIKTDIICGASIAMVGMLMALYTSNSGMKEIEEMERR